MQFKSSTCGLMVLEKPWDVKPKLFTTKSKRCVIELVHCFISITVCQNPKILHFVYFFFAKVEELPIWNFDGSSTGQAEGHNSDVYLHPVALFPDPFRGLPNKIALCETYTHDHKPTDSNKRRSCVDVMNKKEVKVRVSFEKYLLYSYSQIQCVAIIIPMKCMQAFKLYFTYSYFLIQFLLFFYVSWIFELIINIMCPVPILAWNIISLLNLQYFFIRFMIFPHVGMQTMVRTWTRIHVTWFGQLPIGMAQGWLPRTPRTLLLFRWYWTCIRKRSHGSTLQMLHVLWNQDCRRERWSHARPGELDIRALSVKKTP